jgi:hypothetical protein
LLCRSATMRYRARDDDLLSSGIPRRYRAAVV